MTIVQFMAHSSGKWVSHRTRYPLLAAESRTQSEKITLFQEHLPPTSALVVELCNKGNVDPQSALGGLLTRWDKATGRSAGSSLYVPLEPGTTLDPASIPSTLEQSQGDPFLWRVSGQGVNLGRYKQQNEGWVWITAQAGICTEERIWFPGENLRLRSSLSHHGDQTYGHVSFYSEILMGAAGTKP
ncbi:phycobiliprotein lyase [Prochlorothrix hollandica]|uniref:Chromophore lyase CpcS/CpeS n=1 Tax=Prochlorothrix hollandica PCC 9006 = CALU 1027 TaxID=317619 RepID=A0A0M2PY04_PROHO|nr:phycobiliprotein lyase [Prochlorothrix hollandica]KKJ01055.1 hypothetical protein PROH_01165 [Prochlorothrix hollandica PCC 9006 = CALU 1027]